MTAPAFTRLGALLLLLCAPILVQADDFSTHWHDGRAEIDGYRLTIERYGESRSGQAVMIYVTEPMRRSTRVKADDPSHDPADVVDVLKLNLVRDFQTGIYDYNTMTSVFSATSDFECLKVSFSSAEWCGHVYSEIIPRGQKIEVQTFSYFEGESGSQKIPAAPDGWLEEELFLRLRGLRGTILEVGQTRHIRILPSSLVQRLLHRPAEWVSAQIHRATNREVEVPAGNFECEIYAIEMSDGRDGEFAIESAQPRRIIRWSLSPDTAGELTGSLRSAYWQKHAEGDEQMLEALGIQPIVDR